MNIGALSPPMLTRPAFASGMDVEALELSLLLEALRQRTGHDLRGLAQATVERRAQAFARDTGSAVLSSLIPLVLHDASVAEALVRALTRREVEMFRDPWVHRALRERVFPSLRALPHVKAWAPNCGTGEEVYGLAIALAEEQLLDRTHLYATDADEEVLARAREAIYSLERMQEFTPQYHEAGGSLSFSEYYHARYAAVVMAPALRSRVIFAHHDLMSDGPFGEMNLIVCRNVLLSFDGPQQDLVSALLADSLAPGGYLCLGTHEPLPPVGFEVVDERARICRRLPT